MAHVNRYNRQESLNLKIPQVAVVVGCGGIGSWTALFLALAGVKVMYLFDPDVVEEHNLNRTPFKIEQLGKNKAEAVRELIKERDSEIDVFYFPISFDSLFLTEEEKVDCVIDCSDDYETQKMLSKRYKEKYYRAGTHAHHVTVTKTIPSWDASPQEHQEGVCGVTIPQWVAPQVIAGALVTALVCGVEIKIN